MFDANANLVWRFLRRHGLSRAQADDGLQEVFMVAVQRLADIDKDKERSFLCGSAVLVARRIVERKESLPGELPDQLGRSCIDRGCPPGRRSHKQEHERHGAHQQERGAEPARHCRRGSGRRVQHRVQHAGLDLVGRPLVLRGGRWLHGDGRWDLRRGWRLLGGWRRRGRRCSHRRRQCRRWNGGRRDGGW